MKKPLERQFVFYRKNAPELAASKYLPSASHADKTPASTVQQILPVMPNIGAKTPVNVAIMRKENAQKRVIDRENELQRAAYSAEKQKPIALTTLKTGESAEMSKRDYRITVTRRGSTWDCIIVWAPRNVVVDNASVYGGIAGLQRHIVAALEKIAHQVTLDTVKIGKVGSIYPTTYDGLIQQTHGADGPEAKRKHERISASMNGKPEKSRKDSGTARHNVKYDDYFDRSPRFEKFHAKYAGMGWSENQITAGWQEFQNKKKSK